MKSHHLQLLLIPVAILLSLAAAKAQTAAPTERPSDAVIRGRVIDPSDAPVAGAAVVLFNRDSVYLDAVASDADGRFEIRSAVRPYRLQFQHIAYEVRTIESDRTDLGDIRLTEASTKVAAVVVEGERPVVKVEQGRLDYDLGRLTEGQAVNNAYEALTRLPGVMEQEGALTLAGASSVTVILNGRPSTMTPEQLATLLRSTPVDRVEKAEVMFSAPPQYHVRGAAINVVLRRSHETAFSGELHANYTNRYYDTYDAGGNFVLSSPKWSADVTYSAARSKELTSYDLRSLHTFEGRQYDIRQDEWMTAEGWSHQLRAAAEYAPKQRGRVSAAYTASFSPNTDGLSRSTGSYVSSLSQKSSDRSLHNLALRYTSAFGLDLGLDYTHYDNPEQSRLENSYADGSATAFDVGSGQRIDRLNLTADERHAFASGWELTAGGAFSFARSHDWQHYTHLEGSPATEDTDSRLDEYTANLYAGFGRQFGKVGLTASLAGEYYRMGDYENWSLYPQASLNWMPSKRHILQLNFSSDKEYPAYWEMQGAISYIDGYSEIHGTPGTPPLAQLRGAGRLHLPPEVHLRPLLERAPRLLHTGRLAGLRPAGDDLPVAQLELQPAVGRQCRHPVPRRQMAQFAADAYGDAHAAEVRPVPRHVVRPREMGRHRPAREHLPPEPQARHRPRGERLLPVGGHSGHLRHQSPRFGRCRREVDLRPGSRHAFGALQRPLRQRCALDEGTLPRAVARHGGAALHAHRNRTLLLPLRRLQGQKTQGGRYLAFRTLNGPECHESFKTSEDAAASRFGRSDGCWKRACRAAGNSL